MRLNGFHKNLLLTMSGVACAAVCVSSCSTKSGAPTGVTTGVAQQTPPGASADKKNGTPEKLPGTTEIKFEKPQYVRGIYLTAWSAGSPKKMEKVFEMLKKTELNSVVIDVRDTGEMYWKTGIPLAAEAKANDIAIVDGKKVMQSLAANKVYPIARIACFRDNFVPKVYPQRAVQLTGGGVWKDRSGHSWLDPYNKKNWDYVAATVDYALDQGFPEIQLDYVRFPSEGKAGNQVFPSRSSYKDPKALPEDVIAEFCQYVRDRVKKRGAMFSADIFGIISSTKKDQGIGQELEKVAGPFDVISPMVYPSHFAHGEYGIPNPNLSPYMIVRKSLHDYVERVPNKPVRPWLQDFSLFHVKYGIPQIKAQIKAAQECGYKEYLMWNANNHYTEDAYKDNSKLLADKSIGSGEKDPHPAKKEGKDTKPADAKAPAKPAATKK